MIEILIRIPAFFFSDKIPMVEKKCGAVKVEKILKGTLDSIPSPSPSVKIQIMGGNVCNVLPYYLK